MQNVYCVADKTANWVTDSQASKKSQGISFAKKEKSSPVIAILDENNAVFETVCDLWDAYEKRAFIDAIQIGAYLMMELQSN